MKPDDIFFKIVESSKINFYLFEVSFKDFVEITNLDFEDKLERWWEIYLNDLKKLTDKTEFEFTYEPDYEITNEYHNDRVKAHIYDWSKYHYFCTAGLKTYRVPLNIVRLEKPNTFFIHPGNARTNCMSWWKDHYRVKVVVTDNNLGDLIMKFAAKSAYCYNFQNADHWFAIKDILNLDTWKNVNLKYTQKHGYELAEQHCGTDEFRQKYVITFNTECVKVNDRVIFFKTPEGKYTFNPIKPL